MSILDKAKDTLQAIIDAASSGGAKAVTGPIKDVTGAAKDVVDIRKGVVETRLAEKRLEQEESLIQKVTLEEVKQIDPKVQKIVS
jgi:hypothetical protein